MWTRRFFIWSVISLISGLGTCKHCPSSDNESILQRNKAYTYRFRSEALAQAVGTTDDHGKIILECDVHVNYDRPCYYFLNLKQCVVTATGGQPGSQTAWIDHQPLPDLSKYPIAFSLINGEINEVKTHDEDPVYYVNIKRGVLSAFVFKLSQTEKEIKEIHTDIHGVCPMTSKPDEELAAVKTSKDMLHCQFPSRPDWQFSPWSLFWNMSFIQNVINSTTDCIYNINKNERKLEEVTCKERHAIMLESTQRTTTAVQTNVNYHLVFMASDVQTSKPTFPILARETGIQYEYEETPLPQSSPQNFLPVAEKMLADLVLDSVDEIRLFSIPQFTDFVAWLRSSHDLRPFADRVRSCSFLPEGVPCEQKIKDLAYSYLSDALLQCNSLPSIKAVTYMAQKGDLSPVYLNMVYISWSYMHYAKPGFIANFMDICRMKNSHQCWMSIGSHVQRVYERNNNLEEKVLKEAKEVTNYFYSRIGEDCDVNEDTSQPPTDCLVYMKAASNMGRYYVTLQPEGLYQLLEVITNENSPVVVRTSALEALKDIFVSEDRDARMEIYDQLLPLFKNETLASSIRILAYDQLLVASEDHYFEEHVLSILKDGKNAEVKNYVADALNTLMADREFIMKRQKFLRSILDLLREHGISLEKILYEHKGKSRSSSSNFFLNFPFLPDFMKRFGLKIRDTFIYDSHIHPSVFNHKAVFQLLSTILPTTRLGSYFEGFEEILLAYQKNLREMDSKATSPSKVFESVIKTVAEIGKNMLEKGSLHNFDENVVLNVKKLHRLYWQHHKKLNPYAKAYFDIFGSTVKHFVMDSLPSTSMSTGLQNIITGLAMGNTHSVTRVIRVIEAYHQVPTMMGLPLNWTTNATLAFSIRAGLKINPERPDVFHATGVLQPSAALTFLNRMVLDFPTLTQIGVQANSSAYTSTELRSQYDYLSGDRKFRIHRPSKTQKVLELFRTNQLIKHNRYEDIPDWDIERFSSSLCTNSVGGLKLCLAKSYPNVTHRIKPWALMAGWCKWQFLMYPVNQDLVHYDFQFQQGMKHKSKEYNAKFSVTEKGTERDAAAQFHAAIDENGKIQKMELKTSLTPDFKISMTRKELMTGKKVSGHKIEADFKLNKDFKYELEMSNELKVQKSSTQANAPSGEDSEMLVNEEKVSITTPYSSYKWGKSVHKLGEDVKVEAVLSYENLKPKSYWMKEILPPSFWEDDDKAWLKVHLHWKKPISNSQGSVTRHTEFRLKLPVHIFTVRADNFESRFRQQMNVNFAKVYARDGEIEGFLNFTSDWWTNEKKDQYDKDIAVANVTVSRRSYAIMYQKVRVGMTFQHEIKLRRAAMIPIKEEKVFEPAYVGWWSEEVSDRFRLEENEIKLSADNEWTILDGEEIAKKYSSVKREDLQGLGSSVIVNNIVLQYPLNHKTETFVYDGFLILSSGSNTFRFQKNFDLTSSYNNLKLTSHSVYRQESKETYLDHSSYFTHLGTQTKAYNTMYYSFKHPGRCTHHIFRHDIRSHVFDLSTNAAYKCEKEDDNLYTLRLTLNTNSSMWNMLDIKLDQIVEDVSSNYSREEMTTTHAAGTLHVDAEWHNNPKPYHHQKRVVLCSKNGHCPNAELLIENFYDGRANVKFILPNRNDTQITYERNMSPNYKNLDIKVGYFNKQDGMSKVLDFSGEIVARRFHVWKGTLNTTSYTIVKNLIASGYEAFCTAFANIASDQSHPLNQMLQPALKMSLYEYWIGLKNQFKETVAACLFDLSEVVMIVEGFAEPVLMIWINVMNTVDQIFWSTYHVLKERFVTIWAIDYFELPYYVYQGFTYLPQVLLGQITSGDDNILNFKHISGRLLDLPSFREWPYIDFDLLDLKKLITREVEDREVKFNHWAAEQKVAMIFGPSHVYTFDGHLYDIPQYPQKDCLFLLAHDIHRSLFTVLSSEKGIHVLFPEMSLTINEQNEVFINGSRQQSSLPVQSDNGKVTVRRGHVVEVWSPTLSIVCRGLDFLCTLHLSEYHSGGIIGLLGNGDKQAANDYALPSGNTSSSILDFVKMYEVSGKSECKNLAVPAKTEPTGEEQMVCLRKFEGICITHSRMRRKFLDACFTDVQEGRDACYAASGLSALCHLKYMPSHTDCNVMKQEKQAISRILEVVFVVQENKYLSLPDKPNSAVKGIESLVKALDSKFKENGYRSVKYSLVGFGGNGVHSAPSVHSSGKEIWLSADLMIKDGLKTLDFKSRENADGISALKYAFEELGHDSFDSKVFIVITAKDKQVADKSLINHLQYQLEENGITLYAMSSYPSIEKGKKVFGVRADGLIFPSQGQDSEAYLDFPRGDLAKLSASTRGSVFLSKFLRENKPQAFFIEFAQEVWAKINKETQKCRFCRPVRSKWWWYKNECKIVHC